MKAVIAAFNQEKALVGTFSVMTNLRMEHFEALMNIIMMMQECFADLEESEQLMMAEQEASEGALTMTVVRAPVLRDSSSYVHDYAAGDLVTCLRTFAKSFFSSTIAHCPGAEGEEPSYHIIPPSDCENIASVFIDRQQVATDPLSTGTILPTT